MLFTRSEACHVKLPTCGAKPRWTVKLAKARWTVLHILLDHSSEHVTLPNMIDKLKMLGIASCSRATGIPEMNLHRYIAGQTTIDERVISGWIKSKVDHMENEGTLNAICDVYTVTGVAKMLGVSRMTVHRWLNAGLVPEEYHEKLWTEAMNGLA